MKLILRSDDSAAAGGEEQLPNYSDVVREDSSAAAAASAPDPSSATISNSSAKPVTTTVTTVTEGGGAETGAGGGGGVISTCLNTGTCQITVVSPSQDRAKLSDVVRCKQTTVIKMKTAAATSVELSGNFKKDNNKGMIMDDNQSDRVTWDTNVDFLLSIIGFAVDLANVWRFPYLCYKNGGGAFLIPYTLMLVFGAMPLFYMEVILGQYNRQGPISLWKICPIFKGVGYCAVFIAFYVSFYYNVIIGWSLFYLGSSFSVKLPWTGCDNEWNTEFCSEGGCKNNSLIPCNMTRSPAKEYFNLEVLKLQESEGIFQPGPPSWKLVGCICIVYSLLYISLFKGVKSSGKVVWITATMPYLLLSMLLVRGILLPGAVDGMKLYLIPDLTALGKSEVWIDAAVQIFYSVGAGFGVHLAYASYNKFDNNCYRDCLITSCVNSFTSFFSGFVIFTYLGYMAKLQDKPITEVAEQGPGLVFEVYPEAIATLPASQVWSVLFFVMLIFLGMDSAMGGLECVITGLMDEFQTFFKRHKITREMFTGIVVFVSFLVAMSCVTPGGFYIFNLFERYAAGLSLLTTVFFEAVAVSWVYGLTQLKSDIHEMLGRFPSMFWRICWKIVSPIFLFVIICLQISDTTPFVLTLYDNSEYVYPKGAIVIGWIIALSSTLMIPLVGINALAKKPGSLKQRFYLCLSPPHEQDDIINGVPAKRSQSSHWFSL